MVRGKGGYNDIILFEFSKTFDAVSHNLLLIMLESRRLYLDVLFLAKLKFNCFPLTLSDFDIRVSNLHNNRFISLPSYSHITYYFYTVRTICLYNSLHNNFTASRTIFTLRCLLFNVNFIYYLRGRA